MSKSPSYFKGLNENQLAAAKHRDGWAMVNAGAGTGKTMTLVARYLALLLDEEQPSKINEILALTYTETGASVMKQRASESLRDLGYANLANQMSQAWISTFHGFCTRILRRYALQAGIDPHFSIAESMQSKALQEEALDELFGNLILPATNQENTENTAQTFSMSEYMLLRETWTDFTIRKHVMSLYQELRTLGLHRFSPDLNLESSSSVQTTPIQLSENWSARLLIDDESNATRNPTPSRLIVQCTVEFAQIYERLMQERSLLDFNEVLLLVRQLLRDDYILQELQSQFCFVMVDEAQDTNSLQMEIIEAIAGDNLYQVGDKKQSIYGFQGADVSVMQGYLEDPDVNVSEYELTANYRSDACVLDFANALFGNEELLGYPAQQLCSKKEPEKSQTGSRAVHLLEIKKESGPKREATRLSAEAEAIWIADHFEAEHGAGRSWSDFRVLVERRSHAKAIIAEFEKRDIPALLVGGDCLLETPIVNTARLLLDVLSRPREPELLLRCLLSPLSRASDKAIYELAVLRKERELSFLWDAALLAAAEGLLSNEQDQHELARFMQMLEKGREDFGHSPLSEIITRAFDSQNTTAYYLSQGALTGRQAFGHLQQFLALADQWQASGNDSLSFEPELKRRKKLEDKIPPRAVSLPGQDYIEINSIHSSKGDEFKVVALPLAASEKIRADENALVLHHQTKDSTLVLARKDSNEKPIYKSEHYNQLHSEMRTRRALEAIRLLYVACTRAEDMLLISFDTGAAGDGLSNAMSRGMSAAATQMQQLQDDGALTIQQKSVGEFKQ